MRYTFVMTIRDALKNSFLPAADSEVLLSKALGKDRAWLLAHPEEPLTPEAWATFTNFVERRRKSEPVAYITGEQEFYGRIFNVDPRVLIPRPATEGVVRAAMDVLKHFDDINPKSQTGNPNVGFGNWDSGFSLEVDSGIVVTTRILRRLDKPKLIVDLGTGSGCIAVTLACECPDMRVIATDVSSDALDVARSNAIKHHVNDRMECREGNGMEPVKDITEPFLLVTNPPYVPSVRTLMPDVQNYEPHVAIFGGGEGMDVIGSIVTDAKAHPMCVGIIMESETTQVNLLIR